MSERREFAALLKHYRAVAGLTQEQLAERAGLSPRGVLYLERGARQPHPDTLRRLADALDLDAAQREALARAALDLPPAGSDRPTVAPRGTLPLPLTPLLGRSSELAALRALLGRAEVRLLTLTGPGGVGKTRLALEVARDFARNDSRDAFFVALAPVSDPGSVLPAIAQTAGVRQTAGDHSLPERIGEALGARDCLLLLDNCEHLLAAAPAIASLLETTPSLRVLATSRSPLSVRGEWTYPVAPLAIPDDAQTMAPETLAASPAVALFVERARAVRPDFTLTKENAAAVATICARLDGLPLAIELAAGRASILSPTALLERLERRLPLLASRARDLPHRQQTLRDSIAWSYELLAPSEQTVFRRLAIFRGGCTLDAAEAVCQTLDAGDFGILDMVTSLANHSLVRVADVNGLPRVQMLETIREFGLEILEATGERDAVRHAHAAFFLDLAERAAPELLGPRPEAPLERLEADHANLTAALRWFVDAGETVAEARLAGALREYWYATGRWSEGRTWLGRSVARANELPDGVAANVLVAAGFLAHYQGDDAAAVPPLEEGLARLREVGEHREAAYARYLLGVVAEDRGDYATATRLLTEAARQMQDLGDITNAAYAEAHLGIVALGAGNLARAAAHGEAARALATEGGSRDALSVALLLLGDAALDGGDLVSAAERYRDHLATIPPDSTATIESLARAAASVAVLAVASGQPERAAYLLGAAERLRETVGLALALPERDACEQAATRAASDLGTPTFKAALEAGRAMAVEEAVAEMETVLALAHPTSGDHRPIQTDLAGD